MNENKVIRQLQFISDVLSILQVPEEDIPLKKVRKKIKKTIKKMEEEYNG